MWEFGVSVYGRAEISVCGCVVVVWVCVVILLPFCLHFYLPSHIPIKDDIFQLEF